eukprot:TRINITY_DN16316_c0_g1_i3.p1 TRINITY_DN16316_c0_g1~~TRINITY_DN16316_c0_g1_i3.p1  ORF type:complete len:123 (+),score=6.90 TRINITY_DN16316_c0_g1_i3:46-369(+)
MVVLAMDTFSKRGRNNVGVRNASPPCRSQTGTFGVVEPQRTMSGTQRKIRRAGGPQGTARGHQGIPQPTCLGVALCEEVANNEMPVGNDILRIIVPTGDHPSRADDA